MEPPQATYKVVLFGRAAVGKTSLFAWTMKKQFDVNVASTISVMYATHPFTVEGSVVNAQIWDTAGQERYASITKSYFQDASGGLAVFDLTDRETLESMKARVESFKQTAREGAVVVLVGNKKDLVAERQVTWEEGKEVADALGAVYIETSAKDAENVEHAFTTCVAEVAKVFRAVRPMSIVLSPPSSPSLPVKPSKCCK